MNVCTHPMRMVLLRVVKVQPVPAKTRLEMVIGIQHQIRDGESCGLFSIESCGLFSNESCGLFSNEPYVKKPVMTIEDFGLYSDDDLESRLLGNGLYSVASNYRSLLQNNVFFIGLFCKRDL